MSWTEERVEALKLHWAAGLSCSSIANEIGGVTRNAVIGKVHRLKLPGRNSNGASAAPRPKSPRPQPPRPTTRYKQKKREPWSDVVDLAPEITPTAVTIAELEEYHCRWPVAGEGANMLFCGANRTCARRHKDHLPYCKQHCRMAYRAPERRA